MILSSKDYEAAVGPTRARFTADPAVRALFLGETDAPTLWASLLYFNALGVHMTEPVEGWIRQAGERCQQVGVTDLGRSLEKSAKLEKEHHLMMIDDVRFLTERWNRQYPLFPLSAEEILATPPTQGVKWYCAVHEEFIAGPTPYAQVAFMQEIERLAHEYGLLMVGGVRRLLGEEMLAGVSFIHFHIENDISHAALSHHLLDTLLAQHPESLSELVRVGEKAIDSYRIFLGESLALGRALVARMAQ